MKSLGNETGGGHLDAAVGAAYGPTEADCLGNADRLDRELVAT